MTTSEAKRLSKMSKGGSKAGKAGKSGSDKEKNSVEDLDYDMYSMDFPKDLDNNDEERILENLRKGGRKPKGTADPDLVAAAAEGGLDLVQGQQELLGRVMELTDRVMALQHTLTNIKLQNHYIYKSMKRNYKMCKTGGATSNSPNDVIQAAAQTLEKPVCPADFTENPNTNTCYRFHTERISWRMARERCRRVDADLVSIETKSEQRWITQQARHNIDTRHCDFWTGGSDKKAEGDWRWVANNNALSYSNWNLNEPNNGRENGEHCLQMLWVFNWAWNDAHCDYHNACFICETGKRRPDARL